MSGFVGRPEYVLVPVAIREDAVVRVHFPPDITPEEAAKVARVIQAYADIPRDSRSKPDRATTAKTGVVHESDGAGTAIAQRSEQ